MSTSYRDAARILEKHWGKRRLRRGGKRGKGGGPGLKAMVLAPSVQNKGLTKAVVYETLKFEQAIDQVLQHAKLRPEQLAKNIPLLYVMLYDHLFGQGIRGGGAVKRAIKKYEKELKEALLVVRKEHGVEDNKELVATKLRMTATFPRYARVNLLKATLDETRKELKADGLQVDLDEHIGYLLKLAPNAPLYNHALVTSGKLILQDKSSCFPAEILCRALGDLEGQCDVIDATAAPGNKTSQLAALLHSTGKDATVFAFDKSERRLSVLVQRMKQAGKDNCEADQGHHHGCTAAEHVKPMCANFLKVDPSDEKYQAVKGILVDPSCSGSGMVTRLDHLLEETDTVSDADEHIERLAKLAEFQKECLTHALSFPTVQYVTYSTCSVHKEENEEVVAEVLKQCDQFELAEALPGWEGRGIACEGLSDGQVKSLVRVDPKRDHTNGFFVALLKRKEPPNRKKRKMQERRKRRRKKARAMKKAKAAQELKQVSG